MMKANPLRVFRKEKGWTRAEMARRTGVNYQTLDLIETGLIGKVTSKVMKKLAPFGIPEDLPEQYQAWKLVMAQYVEPKPNPTEGDAVNEENPPAPPILEEPSPEETPPTETGLDEPSLGETI
jgi:transcriptional regulator with XRE-family HTH domain